MEKGRFYQQFGERSGGDSPPQQDIIPQPQPLDAIEADLHALLERQRGYSESKGRYFNPSEYMYSYLLRTSALLFRPDVPEGVDTDEATAVGRKMALALGMLAYPQWRPDKQMELRAILQTDGFIQYCEEAQAEWKQKGLIDWEREDKHQHYIKLPKVGRQLLKGITNVTGIPYDLQQDTFFFSTVLDQPEPDVPEGS